MIVPRNIVRHELIGLDVLVVRASNPAHAGISGTIINETRNMMVIRTTAGLKQIPKQKSLFRITLPSGASVELEGSSIQMAPDRRISIRENREVR